MFCCVEEIIGVVGLLLL